MLLLLLLAVVIDVVVTDVAVVAVAVDDTDVELAGHEIKSNYKVLINTVLNQTIEPLISSLMKSVEGTSGIKGCLSIIWDPLPCRD